MYNNLHKSLNNINNHFTDYGNVNLFYARIPTLKESMRHGKITCAFLLAAKLINDPDIKNQIKHYSD